MEPVNFHQEIRKYKSTFCLQYSKSVILSISLLLFSIIIKLAKFHRLWQLSVIQSSLLSHYYTLNICRRWSIYDFLFFCFRLEQLQFWVSVQHILFMHTECYLLIGNVMSDVSLTIINFKSILIVKVQLKKTFKAVKASFFLS